MYNQINMFFDLFSLCILSVFLIVTVVVYAFAIQEEPL